MGRAPCCEKVGLKRGRWTAEEDKLLINYITVNGEGSWRALPKNAGLLRCGKSCRLRWINYLRSDLKRGNISVEEEELIVRLRASLGNRWSLIAGHLPGRTDNEIKNYWNSHLSRKLQSSQITSDQDQGQSTALPSSAASEGLIAKAAGHKRKHKSAATSGAGLKTRQPKQRSKKLISSTDGTAHPSSLEQPSKLPAVDNTVQKDTFDDITFTVPDPLAGDGFSSLGSVSGEESAGCDVICSSSPTSTTDSRPSVTDYDQELNTSELSFFEDLLTVDPDDHHGLMNMVDCDFDGINACRDLVDVDCNKWDINNDEGNLAAVFGEEAQDMLSWLWDFDDSINPGVNAGAGAGAGVGNLDYGNAGESEEKYDAMVAWLLS